jgi:uridylate kinase
VFSEYCRNEVVVDPTAAEAMGGRILVAGGWKPGFSTDNDAVLLAERFGADTVINLSNIEKIYTADPRVDPDARPIDHIGWAEFRKIVGDEWTPGRNLPFDPVAARRGQELGLRVISASGSDLENIAAILRDGDFEGSVIGPD